MMVDVGFLKSDGGMYAGMSGMQTASHAQLIRFMLYLIHCLKLGYLLGDVIIVRRTHEPYTSKAFFKTQATCATIDECKMRQKHLKIELPLREELSRNQFVNWNLLINMVL